tara:strand:+ start:306 stop:653 length:348 start_codon:yes stop_codon:yes gene_type:complete
VAIVAIAKFILTNSLKKARKKYGREIVEKTMQSKTFEKLAKKYYKDSKEDKIGPALMAGQFGAAATTVSLMSVPKKKTTVDKTKNPRIKLLKDKKETTTIKNRKAKDNKLDTYER